MIGHLLLTDRGRNPYSLCCLNDGFLYADRDSRHGGFLHFILIDNKLVQHEQKILSKCSVEQIDLVKFASNTSVLAIYREDKSGDKVGDSRSRLFLDLYNI